MKDRLNVTVEHGLKQKAEEQNINMSEAIENALKEKTKGRDEGCVIFAIRPYGIILQSMNYVVARLSDDSTSTINHKDFNSNTNTYHPNLHQALIQLSKRLLEDKLKLACKDKPLELKELAMLVQDHHEYFVNLVKGM